MACVDDHQVSCHANEASVFAVGRSWTGLEGDKLAASRLLAVCSEKKQNIRAEVTTHAACEGIQVI